jgi:MFS family permease
LTRSLATYLRSFTGFGRDARLFLLLTVIFGSGQSLYWIDFNLYLGSIGIGASTLGWLLATSQLAGVLVALPASALSDRVGRRTCMAGGAALVTLALLAFLPGRLFFIFLGVAAWGAGSQIIGVVSVPYIAEHTLPEQRNHYFSAWQAISFVTTFLAAILGAQIATWLAPQLGLLSEAGAYQVLLTGVAILGAISFGTVFLLSNDRPVADPNRPRKPGRFGLVVHDRGLFFKLLLPGFLTALGAGQLIPFLNVFIATKFDLGLEGVNTFFAITGLGTAIAIMIQPALARRFGRIGSIVLVQGASIPFLVVLGFSPVMWTVIVALTVRNSLMNAGSPIFDAFAMERVSEAERATLAGGMSLLWSLGWTIAPVYYSLLQDNLGFSGGFSVDFVTIIILYTLATSLLWIWFRGTDTVPAPEAEAVVATVPGEEMAVTAIERA